MSDSLRYKIVLWMVWVQIAFLPIIIVMINVTNSGVMWRWNLLNCHFRKMLLAISRLKQLEL